MLQTIQLKKESKAYSWPKKEMIFREAKHFKVNRSVVKMPQEKDSMKFLNVGARTARKLFRC